MLREQQLTKNRKDKNKSMFHKATSFTQEDDLEKELISPINVEEEVIMKVWIEQSLKGRDLIAAKLLLQDKKLTLEELGEKFGLKHREQVRKMFKKLKQHI